MRDAGVIGAGGAGYPAHLKLQSKADTVIINGAECEPLLYTDKTLLKHKAEDVVEGLKIIMAAMKAKEGIIAINRNATEAVSAVKAAGGQVHLLEDYYPSGDEFLLVYDTTKKVIPENGNPLTVGVAVWNVATSAQIYHAVNGKPTTERMVTIAGEVKNPKVVSVPVGTRYADLIALAGGSTLKEFAVIDGGPMMGNLVTDFDEGIGKSTRAIVLLPLDHFVIRTKSKTVSQIVKESKAASGQNLQATELCPRHLLGHDIHPHEAMITVDYQRSEPSSAITSSFLCSGCGLCEMVGCDSNFISPKKIFNEYQRLLTRANIENPHKRTGFPVHSQFENRKMPTPMLLKKLGLSGYEKKLSFEGEVKINVVKIPLNKHLGAPAEATVHEGKLVRRGDVIAESESCVVHASIHGTISRITEQFIEISS